MMQETASEYSQALSEFGKLQTETTAVISRAAESRAALCSKWSELKIEREKVLEKILAERGLTICSATLISHAGITDEQMLGLFPHSQMRLLYKAINSWAGGHGYEHRELEPELLLLCADHFPVKPNRFWPSDYPEEKPNMTSEVEKKDGKLVTVINQVEVAIPVKKYYSEGVYQFFGLPNLPEYPN